MHCLHFHLDFFPKNNNDVSDKHGERFHQDIKIIEEWYQGKVSPAMMVDFCCSLYKETLSKDTVENEDAPNIFELALQLYTHFTDWVVVFCNFVANVAFIFLAIVLFVSTILGPYLC